eukprot:scaffold1204_cov407-Prasinococcus_capsulatus_cf.AAC.16
MQSARVLVVPEHSPYCIVYGIDPSVVEANRPYPLGEYFVEVPPWPGVLVAVIVIHRRGRPDDWKIRIACGDFVTNIPHSHAELAKALAVGKVLITVAEEASVL